MTAVSSPVTLPDADASAHRDFRTALHGELLAPSGPGYGDARRVWNAMIDRHPALVTSRRR